MKSPWKLGKIAVVQDALLPKEKSKALTSVLNELRKDAEIELLKGTTTEEIMLAQLQSQNYSAILVPWRLYFEWGKVERHFGRARGSGPVMVGYTADRFEFSSLPQAPQHLKILLLDLGHLLPSEARCLLVNTVQEERRSGIRPFFEDQSVPVHFENWQKGAPYGDRADQVLALPAVSQHGWISRTVDFRIAHLALWNLIFREDDRPIDTAHTIPSTSMKGQLQVAAERGVFVMRLCASMPSWKITDLLERFYPPDPSPNEPLNLLMRHTDFLRINLISDTPFVEITCGYFPSYPSVRYPFTQRSVSVQTIASSLVYEIPMENPSASTERPMIPLRTSKTTEIRSSAEQKTMPREEKSNARILESLHFELKRLRELLADREETIRELKSGGVGTPANFEPPDVEALLESFQDRYAVARYQIEQFRAKLQTLTQAGANLHSLAQVQQSLTLLLEREQVWIQTLAKILQQYSEDQAKRGKQAA